MVERLHYYATTRQVRIERDAMIDTLAAVTHAAICVPAPVRGVRKQRQQGGSPGTGSRPPRARMSSKRSPKCQRWPSRSVAS